MRRRTGRAGRGAALLLAAGLGLGGCTALSANEQARAGGQEGYVAGDGSYQQFTVDERGEPIVVVGADTAGKPLSNETFRGQVVVLNLWYAACGPCRDEAPDLAKIAAETAPEKVQFIGIDTRDDPATAAAFERTFATGYPSIVDTSGDAALALRGVATPNAVPTTLVLDKQGRVAAHFSGRINASNLRSAIATAVAEPA